MKNMNGQINNRRLRGYTWPVILAGGSLLAATVVWFSVPRSTLARETREPRAPALAPAAAESAVRRDAFPGASFSPVIKKVAPSVVRVSTTVKARTTAWNGGQGPDPRNLPFFKRFFGEDFEGDNPRQPLRMPPQRGEGSGVIVSKDGYLLTNNHVVEGADEVKVTLPDGREFTAKVVGKDPKSDVAVLKVEADGLPAIPLADSERVEVGDIVLAIGNPFGIGQTVTLGMVSAKGRAPLGLDYEDFIQTDAAINPGNSGGALVDTEGRLIGINTAILSRSGGNQGIGFAIPVNLAQRVMTSLVKDGHVIRGYMGVSIQDITPALAREFKLDRQAGALVAEVVPGSPAARAGLASGDVILEFKGWKVPDSRHLKLKVAEAGPGESVALRILRDGRERTLEVKVGELPGEPAAIKARHAAPDPQETLQGVGVADLDRQARAQFKVPDHLRGALITSVEPDSAAAEAGLKAGDVILEINREKVADAAAAVRMTGKSNDRVTLVRVWSQGGTRYVVVDESKKSSS